MKKGIMMTVLGILIVCTLSLQKTAAYEPTGKDINTTWSLMDRLFDSLKQKKRSIKDVMAVEQKLATLQNSYKNNPQLLYTFTVTHDYLAALRMDLDGTTHYFQQGQAFLDAYDTGIVWTAGAQKTDLMRCFAHYPLVDYVAREIGTPPAFIMATWYMESSCRMTNPANGDGLFQIVNNDYTAGDIDLAGLTAQLYDFKSFVQRKFTWYNTRQDTPVLLTHITFNKDVYQTFTALYNGLSGPLAAYPLDMGNPYYFYGNYSSDYQSKKDGWLVLFIKILHIEKDMFGK